MQKYGYVKRSIERDQRAVMGGERPTTREVWSAVLCMSQSDQWAGQQGFEV